MAKGSSTPAGVRCFGYESGPAKGKFQPSEVNAGQPNVKSYGGGVAKPKLAKGGANATPAGVKKHSGTEGYTKVVHKNASHGGPAKKAGAGATPEGVRKFSGKSVGKK